MTLARIGPYRLLRLLGRGGMAEVHLGQAVGASGFVKPIALKLLREELRGDATYEKLLIAEAKLGASLSHRNLVAVHELGVDAGVYFVRMDYVHGMDLASALRERALPPALACWVLDEVLQALSYLHAARGPDDRPLGLLHRDVSPANILVSRSGEVKLADLGLAKATLLQERTRANVRKGTYAYMSPEQVNGTPLTVGSDLFSVGILLHELVTGRRPFDGDTPHETMRRIVSEPAGLDARLSPALTNVVSRCLMKDAAARWSSAIELRRALRGGQPADADADAMAAWLAASHTPD
jgi:serine/threonine-protein kinase